MSELSGRLPSGTTFATFIGADSIVLNVDGRICAAHPRWMEPEQARNLANALMQAAAFEEAQHAGA